MPVNISQVDSKDAKKSISKPPLRQLDLKATPKPKSKSKTALGKLVSRADTGPVISSSRSQREREDDAYIAYLEGKLGKGRKGAEDDDGLDGMIVLQFIDACCLIYHLVDLLDFTSSIVTSLPQVNLLATT